MTDINWNAIFRRTAGYTLFEHKKKEEILEKTVRRNSWQETKKIQIKLATTCKKNDQQQNDKSNAEWMKTTSKRQLDKAETGLLRHKSWWMMMKNLTAYLKKNLIFWG